jgi:putative ABC transport system permease protein
LTDYLRVNPDYFDAMEVHLIKGRLFTEQDREDSLLVAVVDQQFAEKNWPNEDPIGKRVKFGTDPESDRLPWMEVVGIVEHVKSYGVDRESREELYVPYRQDPERAMTLLVKSEISPESLAAAVRSEVLELDPDQPIFDILTLEQYLGERLTTRRLSLSLLSVFAFIALLLASVGVYGVIAFAVAQRTHEIGIRMAMGARAKDVLMMVLRHGMGLAGLGLAIGTSASFLAAPLLASQLFGIEARDPRTLIGTTLVLAAVAFAACFVPARRATRVAPVIALRYE